MKRLAVIMTLSLVFCALQAQNRYATQRLRGIAEALGLSEIIASLPAGTHSQGLAYGSHPLKVVVVDSVVSHIGWRLPPEGDDTEAHRFVERAVLEKALYRADALPVDWDCPDEAFIAEGSIDKVLNADDSGIAYTCANLMGRQCQATWADADGKVLCMVVFPLNYELISGATLRETELRLYGRLRSLGRCADPIVGFGRPTEIEADADDIAALGPDRPGSLLRNIIYLKADTTASSIRPLINDVDISGAPLALVFDPQLPVESLANAVSSTIVAGDIAADVKMMMYGADGRSRSLTMPLSALVGEFLAEGCIPYHALMEGTPEGGVIALAVKMVNPALGYVHLLKVTADPAILFGPEPRVEVTLAAYVNDKPTQEIEYINE